MLEERAVNSEVICLLFFYLPKTFVYELFLMLELHIMHKVEKLQKRQTFPLHSINKYDH